MSQRDSDNHTADQWSYHMTAINSILESWRCGELTTWAKRRAIADENRRYYGDNAEPALTSTGKRYDAPAVLAAAAGVDEDIMTIALNAYSGDGRQAYDDVMAAALGRHR